MCKRLYYALGRAVNERHALITGLCRGARQNPSKRAAKDRCVGNPKDAKEGQERGKRGLLEHRVEGSRFRRLIFNLRAEGEGPPGVGVGEGSGPVYVLTCTMLQLTLNQDRYYKHNTFSFREM